jgi:hypothetical protein
MACQREHSARTHCHYHGAAAENLGILIALLGAAVPENIPCAQTVEVVAEF